MSVQSLQICHMCRRICVGTGMYERWVTKQAYRYSTGIDPIACRMPLTHTYCPNCVNYIAEYREAA
jgi:hypothetical protein